MPTRQTNLTSETKRDFPGRGHDGSAPLLTGAMDDIPAATRPNAAIAAQDNASPETHAAGPPATSPRRILTLLKRYWRALQQRRRRYGSCVGWRDLSDRQLIDIGVTSAEIECIAARREFERLRDGTAYLWARSRGVM